MSIRWLLLKTKELAAVCFLTFSHCLTLIRCEFPCFCFYLWFSPEPVHRFRFTSLDAFLSSQLSNKWIIVSHTQPRRHTHTSLECKHTGCLIDSCCRKVTSLSVWHIKKQNRINTAMIWNINTAGRSSRVRLSLTQSSKLLFSLTFLSC